MDTIKSMFAPALSDAELVQAAREGSHDAYRQIVARYQSLICSLAYCGTGNVTRSEDIAQDTFVTAWRGLCDLRDPASLRVWLCGIARNLTSNSQRHSAREPAEIGGPLDSLREVASPDPSPVDQATRKEEEAILWRAVGRIPENYREPLILYYREQRSVARVAEKLGLSEDATKQRLARGRALIQEQLLALIEGTLQRTTPGSAFTNAVISVLPALGTSMAAAVATSTAKASTATKAVSSAGGAGFGAALMGLFAGIAGYIGWQMGDSAMQSPEERNSVHRFWRLIPVGMAVFIVPTFLMLMIWHRPGPWFRVALIWWLGAFYVLVGALLAIWVWENHVRVRWRRPAGDGRSIAKKLGVASVALLLVGAWGALELGFPSGYWTDLWLEVVFAMTAVLVVAWGWVWTQPRRDRRRPQDETSRSRSTGVSRAWVALATAGMAVILVFSILDMKGWQSERISEQAARDLVTARHDARIYVLEYQNGPGILEILVPGTDKAASRLKRYRAPLNESTLQKLESSGAAYKTLKQGQDFEVLGWPGRMLFPLSVFVVVAGTVILARTPRKQPGSGVRG